MEFPRGITAIIGPNGSGKSNLIEALKWVTSSGRAREYRATDRTELIFHGATTKRSLGFTEVEIELATEGTPLKIRRSLYRDGTTKLKLNGQNSRQLDVQERLAGSGLSRGSLAIIGQGEVSEVLLADPEKLLQYLAEAANITTLRDRRETSKARLENAQLNLERLGDLLIERREHLDNLEQESRRALWHQELSERAHALRFTLARLRFESLSGDVSRLHQSLEVLEQEIARGDSSLSKLRTGLQAARGEVREAQESYRASYARAEAKRGDVRVSRERRARIEDRHNNLETQLVEARRERTELGDPKPPTAPAGNLEELERDERNAFGDLIVVQKENERLAAAVRSERDELQGLRARATTEELAHARYEATRQQLEQQLRLLDDQPGPDPVQESTLEQLKDHVNELEQAHEEARQALEASRTELGSAQNKHAQANAEADAAKTAVERARRALQARRGYQQGPRIALESGLEGIHGSVADLIDVPEMYRQAIASALGRRAQYVVVDTAETGKQVIDYTRRHTAWVTVLPLDLLDPKMSRPPSGLLEAPGVIGLASSVVRTKARYRSVADQLLNNVLLVETLDVAVDLARSYRRRPRLITLDGDTLEPSGAMSGGRAPLTVNVLGAAQELERTEQNAEAFSRTAEKTEKRLVDATTAYERARERERDLAATVTVTQRRLGRVREERAASKRLADQQETQREHIQSSLATLTPPQRTVSERELDQAGADVEANQSRLERAAAQTQYLQQRHQQAQQAHLIYKEQVKGYQQAYHQHQKDLQRLAIIERQITTLKTTLEENLTQLEMARRDEEDAEKALPDDLDQKEVQAKQAEEKALGLENALSELTVEQARRGQEAERTRLSLARRETSLEVATEELEQYPPGLELQPGTERGIRQQLQEVSEELEAVGPVNHLATRAYQEQKDQVETLERESGEALQATRDLEEVLERLDVEITSRLSRALKALRRSFQRYAEELFDGQVTAGIEVETEQGRPVGMRIKLQPPGKRTPDLRLLSVGERTMGALAFLFALTADGGLPIAVLDEVDAPLDEINIRRYCKFLKRLAEDGTQFILITHQKATLEVADVLWGVTTDGGASRLFSIRKDETAERQVVLG